MCSQRRNRTSEHRFETFALANLSRYFGCQALSWRPHHVTQRLSDALGREDCEKWGLLQLHHERPLERVVKIFIAGLVVEIRNHDCVLISQYRRAIRF